MTDAQIIQKARELCEAAAACASGREWVLQGWLKPEHEEYDGPAPLENWAFFIANPERGQLILDLLEVLDEPGQPGFGRAWRNLIASLREGLHVD